MQSPTYPLVNIEQAEEWNGYEGRQWATNQERWDAVNGAFNAPLFAAAAIGPQDRVLDIGCGNGQTTRLAARRAERGHVVGIDLSAPMLERARALAAAEGLTNMTFEQGDAQVHPFPHGSFDVAISRFGVMFFTDPIAAFANIGRALRPGGRVAVICMQDAGQSELFGSVAAALRDLVALPPSEPGAAGMFSLANPGHIDRVFTNAGFAAVTATPVEAPMVFGQDADDAARFLLATGPLHFLLEEAESATRAQAGTALAGALRAYEEPDGVRLRGGAWVVTATAQGYGV
jgi:SAM-dependent methyltransferase